MGRKLSLSVSGSKRFGFCRYCCCSCYLKQLGGSGCPHKGKNTLPQKNFPQQQHLEAHPVTVSRTGLNSNGMAALSQIRQRAYTVSGVMLIYAFVPSILLSLVKRIRHQLIIEALEVDYSISKVLHTALGGWKLSLPVPSRSGKAVPGGVKWFTQGHTEAELRILRSSSVLFPGTPSYAGPSMCPILCWMGT